MLISGCGQKGPLRLPPPPPEENQPNQNDTLPAATLNLDDSSSNISTDISSGKSKAE
jgi:predicted small lipoprotein YifL